MQACGTNDVKHEGLQDAWCAAKSASRMSGVKLARRAAQSCPRCSPAFPSHAHRSFVMRDPRVQVLARLPEVTGDNESIRACTVTGRNVKCTEQPLLLYDAHIGGNSCSTSQSAFLVVPTRWICHQVHRVQPYRLPSSAESCSSLLQTALIDASARRVETKRSRSHRLDSLA